MPPLGEITEKTDDDFRSTRRPIELIGAPAAQRSQISDRWGGRVINATSLFHVHTPSFLKD